MAIAAIFTEHRFAAINRRARPLIRRSSLNQKSGWDSGPQAGFRS